MTQVKNDTDNIIEKLSADDMKVYLVEIMGEEAELLHNSVIKVQDFKGYKKYCSMFLMDNVLNNEAYDRYKCRLQTMNWRRNVEFDFYATHADVSDEQRRQFAIIKGDSEAAKLWGVEA